MSESHRRCEPRAQCGRPTAAGAMEEAREADEALARGELRGPLHGVPMVNQGFARHAGSHIDRWYQREREFRPSKKSDRCQASERAGAILLGENDHARAHAVVRDEQPCLRAHQQPLGCVEDIRWEQRRGCCHRLGPPARPLTSGAISVGAFVCRPTSAGSQDSSQARDACRARGTSIPLAVFKTPFQQLGPLGSLRGRPRLILPLIAGPDFIDPGVVAMPLGDPKEVELGSLRIGFHTDNGIRTPTAETQSTVRAAAGALMAVSRLVEESRPPGVEDSFKIGWPMYRFDGGATVRRLLRQAGTTETSLGADRGPAMSAEELDQALANVYELRSRMLSYFMDYDAFLCPVNAHPAVPHGSVDLPDYSYTMTYNVTGWPGAVVRGGTSPEGLPIGVQIVGPPVGKTSCLRWRRLWNKSWEDGSLPLSDYGECPSSRPDPDSGGDLKRTTQHLGDDPSHGFGGGAEMQRRRADHGRRLSHGDHVEIQRRVSEGEAFASAAAAVGCSTKSIQRFMARTGGMMPRSRARSPLRLSLADREELSRGLMAGDSLRQIAARLGRARLDGLTGSGLERPSRYLSRVAGREDGRAAGAKAEAREVGDPSPVVP